MADYRSERGTVSFWLAVGLCENAARVAAKCFPEGWCSDFELYLSQKGYQAREKIRLAKWNAEQTVTEAPLSYRLDARHPAFWLEQGHEWDEAAARAVAANAMFKLNQPASPPPPPQPDRFAEVAQALLIQAAAHQQLQGPDSGPDPHAIDVRSQTPTPVQNEPFDPNDYPRFRTRRS
jgi:hypothetical protein